MKTAYETALTLNLPPLVRRSITTPDMVEQVMAFHHFYDVPMQPFGSQDREMSHMDNARIALRLGFQIEELKEVFKKAFGIDLIINYCVPDSLQRDKSYERFQFTEDQMLAALNRAEHEGFTRVGKEVADGAADSIYFWIGFLIEAGYDLRDVFREVHASNMTKPDEDGNPVKREDGKVLKGPNYMEPNIPAALGWSDR